MQLQSLEPSSHSWWQVLIYLLTGGGAGVFGTWLLEHLTGRKQRAAGLIESQARVQQMESQAVVNTGHVVGEMVAGLLQAQQLIKEQAIEIIELRNENDDLKGEKAARLIVEQELDQIRQNAIKSIKPPS